MGNVISTSTLRNRIMSGRARPWQDLPNLIIFSVAMRLSTSVRDLVAFGGTCKAWRSLVLSEVLGDFTERQPLTLLVPPRLELNGVLSFFSSKDRMMYGPKGIVSFVRTTDGMMYERLLDPGFCFLAHSYGHLLMVHRGDALSVILMNIFTGGQKRFTPAPRGFQFASLSASPTSPDCLLVLASTSAIQYCRIGGGSWTVMEYRNGIIPKAIGRDRLSSAVAIKDRLYAATFNDATFTFSGLVLEIKIDHPTSSRQLLDSPSSLREIGGLPIIRWPPALTELDGKLILVPASGKAYQLVDSSTRDWVWIEGTPWRLLASDNRSDIFGMKK